MDLLTSEKTLFAAILQLSQTSENLVLAAPYMRANVVQKILDKRKAGGKTTILTTLKPRDVIFGSSDLGVYDCCRGQEIPYLINNNIHLKAYMEHGKCAIIGSANLSDRALGLSVDYNYEIGQRINLSLRDKIYFDRIIAEATEVDDVIMAHFKSQVAQIEDFKDIPEDFSFPPGRRHFLLSALPQSDSPRRLFDLYQLPDAGDETDRRCAEADLRNYRIAAGLNKVDFFNSLKAAFFQHPFIVALLNANDNYVRNGQYGMQFGMLKEWIHGHTPTVPVPRRQDITEPLQNILAWVVELGDGRYRIDVPGRHSQVLRVLT